MSYPIGYNLNNQYGIQSAGYANNLGLQGQTPFMGQTSDASIYTAYNTPTQNIYTPDTLQYTDLNQMMTLGRYQALSDPGGGPNDLLEASDGNFEPEFVFESSEEWNLLAALARGFTHYNENAPNTKPTFTQTAMSSYLDAKLNLLQLTSPTPAPAPIVQPPVTLETPPTTPTLEVRSEKHSTPPVIPETTPSGAPPPAASPLLRSYSALKAATDDTLSPLEKRMKKWITDKEPSTNQAHIKAVVDNAADLNKPLIDQYYENIMSPCCDKLLNAYLSSVIPENERMLLENHIITSTNYRSDQRYLSKQINKMVGRKTKLTTDRIAIEAEQRKLETKLQETAETLNQKESEQATLEAEVTRLQEQQPDIATQINALETENLKAQAAIESLTAEEKQRAAEFNDKQTRIQELTDQERTNEESSRAEINSLEARKTSIEQAWLSDDAKYKARLIELDTEIFALAQKLKEFEESEPKQKSQLEDAYAQANKAYQEAEEAEIAEQNKLQHLQTQSNLLTSEWESLTELYSRLASAQTAIEDKLKELNQTYKDKQKSITQINTDLASNSLALTANKHEIYKAEIYLATLRFLPPPQSLSQYLLTKDKLNDITEKIKARPKYQNPISITEIIEGPKRERGKYIKPTTEAEKNQRNALAMFVMEHREQILKGQNIDVFVQEYNRKLQSNYLSDPNYKNIQQEISLQEQRLTKLKQKQVDLLAQQSALTTELRTTTTQADLDTLNSTIQALQTDLEDIQNQSLSTQQEINQKQQEIRTTQEALTKTRESITELQAQRTTLQTTRDNALKQKEETLTKLAEKKAELKAKLEKKKKASQEAQEKYAEKESEKNSKLEAENAKIKDERERRQKEHDDYTKSIEELQEAAKELQSQKEELKKQIEEKEKKIEENKTEIATQTATSKHLEDTINTKQQELRDNEEEQKKIQAERDRTEEERSRTARVLQTKTKALDDVESSLQALIKEKETLDQTYRTDSILFPRQKSLMEAWHQEADELLKTKKYLADTDIKTIKAKLVEQLKTEISQLKQLKDAREITEAEYKTLSRNLNETFNQIKHYIKTDFAKDVAKPAVTTKATTTPSSSTPSSSTPEGKPTTPASSTTPPKPSKPTTESSPTAEDTARQEQIKNLKELSEAYKNGSTPTFAQADLALEEYQKSQKAIITILSATTENESDRKAVLTAAQQALEGKTDLNSKITAVNDALAAVETDTGKALYEVFKQNPDSFIDTIKNISPDTNIPTIQRKFGQNSILKQQSFGSVFKSEFTQDLQNKGDWAVTGIQAAGTVAMAAYEEYQATGKIGEATADAVVVGGMEAIGGKLGGDLASGLARAAMAGGKVGGTWGAVIGAATAVIGGFVGTKFFGDLGKKLTGNDG